MLARCTPRRCFLMTELRPGTPLPVTLTVFEQPDLRMSPAIGVSPQAVVATLEKVFTRAAASPPRHRPPTADPRLRDPRLHSIEEQKLAHEEDLREAPEELAAEAGAVSIRRLSADYWYTVPGSKQVLLVKPLDAGRRHPARAARVLRQHRRGVVLRTAGCTVGGVRRSLSRPGPSAVSAWRPRRRRGAARCG